MSHIPGPKGTWPLGSVISFSKDPPEFLNQLARKYGDVVLFRLGTLPFYLFSNPDDIQELLVKKVRSFKKMDRDVEVLRRFLGEGLLTSGGAFHKKQRALSQPSFRKKRIQLFADAMLDETQQRMAHWQPGQVIDIAQEMMQLTMYIVARTLFQAEVKSEADAIGEAVHVLQKSADAVLMSPILWPAWVPTLRNFQIRRATQKVDKFILSIIAERRKDDALHDRGDLLSTLLTAVDDDGQTMDDEQLRDELVTLFVAGHETTSNAMTWTWYLLSQHPEVEARLHQELDQVLGQRAPTHDDLEALPYVGMVIKEAMRLYPPAWALNGRTATEDVTIGETHIKRGEHLWISPYALHRDSRYYDSPETFDPEHFAPERDKARHKYAYLPFGAGPRVCIGAAYAMTEACLILAAIAQRYRLRMEPGQQVSKNALITLSPKDGIKMRIEPRQEQL